MKIKIKFYVGKLNTKLYDDGMVKKSFHNVCLPVKLIGYVFKIRLLSTSKFRRM